MFLQKTDLQRLVMSHECFYSTGFILAFILSAIYRAILATWTKSQSSARTYISSLVWHITLRCSVCVAGMECTELSVLKDESHTAFLSRHTLPLLSWCARGLCPHRGCTCKAHVGHRSQESLAGKQCHMPMSPMNRQSSSCCTRDRAT